MRDFDGHTESERDSMCLEPSSSDVSLTRYVQNSQETCNPSSGWQVVNKGTGKRSECCIIVLGWPKSLAHSMPLPRDAAAFLLLAEQSGKFWEQPKEKHLDWRVFEWLTTDWWPSIKRQRGAVWRPASHHLSLGTNCSELFTGTLFFWQSFSLNAQNEHETTLLTGHKS